MPFVGITTFVCGKPISHLFGGTLVQMKKSCPIYQYLTIVILFFAIVSTVNADDWPNFRGPHYNGISAEKIIVNKNTTVTQLWEETIGTALSSVAISKGRLYTMGNTGTKGKPETHTDVVYCLDSITGDEIWTFRYKCGLNFKDNTPTGPFATPTVDGDRVYTFSRKGDIYCLNATTGEKIWFRDLRAEHNMNPPFQGGFAGSPLILGDTVILNAGDAGTALNKHTGKTIWLSRPAEAAQATPVPFKQGDRQYVAIFSGYGLVAVDAITGEELWSFPWNTKFGTNAADPIISGDKAFISTWYKMGAVLLDISAKKPTPIWQHKEMQNHYSTCILHAGHLYGFDIGDFKCLNFETGDTVWEKRGGLGRGSLILADENLVILNEKGTLIITPANTEGFKPILSQQIIPGRVYNAPVLAEGRIYARNDKGKLICVKLEQK